MSEAFDWRREIPELAVLADESAAMIDAQARLTRFGQGTRLFGGKETNETLCLPITGTIRVQTLSSEARPTIFFRLQAGESTALTMVRQILSEAAKIEAIAETETDAFFVPRAIFDALISASVEFRAGVFEACSQRIEELVVLIEDTVLRRFATGMCSEALFRDVLGRQSLRGRRPGIG